MLAMLVLGGICEQFPLRSVFSELDGFLCVAPHIAQWKKQARGEAYSENPSTFLLNVCISTHSADIERVQAQETGSLRQLAGRLCRSRAPCSLVGSVDVGSSLYCSPPPFLVGWRGGLLSRWLREIGSSVYWSPPPLSVGGGVGFSCERWVGN